MNQITQILFNLLGFTLLVGLLLLLTISIVAEISATLETECYEYGIIPYRATGGFLSSSVKTIKSNADFFEERCVHGRTFDDFEYDERWRMEE